MSMQPFKVMQMNEASHNHHCGRDVFGWLVISFNYS